MAGVKSKSHKPHGKLGNPKPLQTPKFIESKRKAFGEYGEPIGSKVFGTRYPISIEAKLLDMAQRDRVEFIRQSVIKALEALS